MARWSKWLGIGAAVGVISALVPVVQGRIDLDNPLGKLRTPSVKNPTGPDLEGLDLTRLQVRPQRVITPLKNDRYAELTLDPAVQRAALSQMKQYRVPEGGVVVMDVKTGRVLAYASHVASGKKFDVNVRAEAPAASVFKVVTGATLIEKAGLNARTEQCYHGGRSRIDASELKDNPQRDKWCATLAMAMGRSLNVVFARLASKHITPEELTAMGGALGFGAPVKFVVPNEAPEISVPDNPLEFARTSAGFWNTSLSPLAAASLAQTVANGGVTLQPRIIAKVQRGTETLWEASDEPIVIRRAIKRETADELRKMMIQTVASGSAFKTFHDRKGHPFLPGMQIAGKTGTLTRHKENRHYTWFVGFAPAHKPEVAISALVVNTPLWRIKAPMLARNVLRAYFAARGRRGVTAP
jgi:cell division protein FtsI/penicillin-binding protein 2